MITLRSYAKCPTVVARGVGSASRKRGGSTLGSSLPTMDAQYANMNRAAFDTRRSSTPVPPGATKADVIPEGEAPSRHVARWDVSDRKCWQATLAEQARAKAAKLAALREAKAEFAKRGISPRAAR